MKECNKNHYYFVIALFVAFIFLVLRTIGLYPICFADEYQYSLLSRIQPLSEAHLPNYLYLKIFHWTTLFGDGFLMAARIFNILFFCLATLFIYNIALNYTSRNEALWIAILALLAPINTYTAFFMPEALYYFLFVLSMWSLLRIEPDSISRAWLLPGAVLGLNALVKPHAQLLIPAILLYMLLSVGRLSPSGSARLASAAKACALFLLGVYVVKFGLGYLLAGEAGVNMAGRAYGSIHYEFLDSLPNFLHSLRGHARGLLILFGFPLFIAAYKLFSNPSHARALSYQERTCLLVCLMTCLMVLQVAFFTANIAGQGPYENPNRLHFRYYNFIFIFFLLIATSAADLSHGKNKRILYFFMSFYVLFLIYCFFVRISPYIGNFVDSPELSAFQRSKSILYIFVSMNIVMVYILARSKTIFAQKIYLYMVIPFYFIASIVINTHVLRAYAIPDIFDKTGIVLSEYLTPEQKKRVTIISTDQVGVFRTLFYLDSPSASFRIMQQGEAFVPESQDAEKIFIAVGGDVRVASPAFRERSFGFFRVYVPVSLLSGQAGNT